MIDHVKIRLDDEIYNFYYYYYYYYYYLKLVTVYLLLLSFDIHYTYFLKYLSNILSIPLFIIIIIFFYYYY
jgi:hypothetical protein